MEACLPAAEKLPVLIDELHCDSPRPISLAMRTRLQAAIMYRLCACVRSIPYRPRQTFHQQRILSARLHADLRGAVPAGRMRLPVEAVTGFRRTCWADSPAHRKISIRVLDQICASD